MCTGCKNVNAKLEWNNKRQAENRVESKQSEKCRRQTISQMLRLFDALKVNFTFVFTVREQLSGGKMEKKKKMRKEFQESTKATKDNTDK